MNDLLLAETDVSRLKSDSNFPELSFNQFRYERPNIAKATVEFDTLIAEFDAAVSVDEQNDVIARINKLRDKIETQISIAEVRHSIDTEDKFYKEEQEFVDEATPQFGELINRYYKHVLNSPFRAELEERWGKQMFDLAETAMKTMSPEIIPLLKQENKLISQYNDLLAAAEIPFEGKMENLQGLMAYESNTDREIRKKAVNAKFGFFATNTEEIDDIFDQLVKLRAKIASELGFNNFVELAYARMARTDYNAADVERFRGSVLKYIVPAVSDLYARQQKRLGVEQLYYHDEQLIFSDGNATPHGDAEFILNNGSKMYRELSGETDYFFQYMMKNELLDVENKKSKAGGGYCTNFAEYGAPFIFSNFNGTSADIDVLTHEAGHAFQTFESRDFDIPEYKWPTYEACEIHSMSMEFLTWPWMKLFFAEQTDKYKFAHASHALTFIPYGVAVDEFQHWVYENPEVTPAERDAKWRAIEKKYMPERTYDGNDYLENGGFWKKQRHIFNSPFYYIDYTLAQICAFQFWQRSLADAEDAWTDYLKLCKAGGSMSFLKLVGYANLRSPFDEDCMQDVIVKVIEWLNGVDDNNL